ncbi:carbohydrate ABC transporter permease [Paenibacillus sp. MDMC362]|uniref:carbohydrate ABC transporter permease n=1 Tax=Paenibacillus sp. MDMC362 TaxID=2977365 RepID=UPI000DC5B163|nr:sugar ABC transporter permease [Paenibacillus sp. MDMC362]RAR41782.1 sugar ABC transporter permease [Paenibacillus sp. MDMC362]
MHNVSLQDPEVTISAAVHPVKPQSWWKRKQAEIKASKHSYVLLAPYMILFTLFTVFPVVISMILSFTYFNMLEFPRFVGWDNYTRLFLEDDIFLVALKNTLLFAAITGPISYLACFLFAWVINELGPRLRAFMTLIFYAPSISGNIYFIWLMIFSGDRYGIANGMLIKLGIILEPIQWLKTEALIMPIIILVQLWLSLGTGFLAFIAGLQTVDKTLYEAGAVDGVRNRWQELWYITLPSMRPQLMFGAVIQLTTSFAVADVSIALAGFPSVNYAAETIVTHLIDFGTTRFEMGFASAIATVLFILMVGTNLIVQKLLRKVGE